MIPSDAELEAARIVASEALRADLDPALRFRYHWHRPSALRGVQGRLRTEWAMMPEAERERMIILGVELAGLLFAVIVQRLSNKER